MYKLGTVWACRDMSSCGAAAAARLAVEVVVAALLLEGGLVPARRARPARRAARRREPDTQHAYSNTTHTKLLLFHTNFFIDTIF